MDSVRLGNTQNQADRARAGEALTAAELDELATADLLALGMLADDVRRSRVGDIVTYVRVLELQAGASGASGASGAPRAGEVRITALPESLDAAIAAITHARAMAGPRLLTAFSLADIVDRAWGHLTDVLRPLKGAGLDAIAEAPVDGLADAEAALQACQDAGLSVRCLSIQKPAGGARTPLLMRVRSLVGAFPLLKTMAPLPREQSMAAPTTGYADVRAVALARLALPSVANIQVDWARYGPKLAQVALTFGANDVDRVSPVDDETLGRRRTAVEEVTRNNVAAGFTPVERDAPFDSAHPSTPLGMTLSPSKGQGKPA